MDVLHYFGPGVDEELQTDLEDTHMILKQGDIVSGFLNAGDIQGENEIIFGLEAGMLLSANSC
jgi:hypothetical protein